MTTRILAQVWEYLDGNKTAGGVTLVSLGLLLNLAGFKEFAEEMIGVGVGWIMLGAAHKAHKARKGEEDERQEAV